MITGKNRGMPITFNGQEWIYISNNKPIHGDEPRCPSCKAVCKEDAPDPCIGWINGVDNACCGHGVSDDAYIQIGKTVTRGEEALIKMKEMAYHSKN